MNARLSKRQNWKFYLSHWWYQVADHFRISQVEKLGCKALHGDVHVSWCNADISSKMIGNGDNRVYLLWYILRLSANQWAGSLIKFPFPSNIYSSRYTLMQSIPLSTGNGPMKSIAMESPWASGIGRGCSGPTGLDIWLLLHWHSTHAGM